MSSTEQMLNNAFNSYYKKGLEALDKGDKVAAKRYILLASESLLKLSQISTGASKLNRVKRAEELVWMAERIDVKSKKKQQKESNSGAKSSNNTNKKDDTETKWIEATIPNVSLDDVAGLNEVKEAVNNRIIQYRLHPEIYEKFKKKAGGGILLYGLPGTGKTMVAKAIAHEVKAKFYSVKCSDIVSKWFGEAEQNIRNLFAAARKEEYAIIFFDEFESIGAKRDGSTQSAMTRLIPELLAQMQGFEETDHTLLLIAATNRPWDIDSAFLRPGRFNDPIYVPLPDKEARKFIIEKSLDEIPIDRDISIDEIVDLTEGYNSADVVEFCEKAKDNAINNSIKMGGIVNISKTDILDTAKKVKSSVQQGDLDEMMKFREKFRK